MSTYADAIPAYREVVHPSNEVQEQAERTKIIELITVVALAAIALTAAAITVLSIISLAGVVILTTLSIEAKLITLIFSLCIMGLSGHVAVFIAQQWQNHNQPLSSNHNPYHNPYRNPYHNRGAELTDAEMQENTTPTVVHQELQTAAEQDSLLLLPLEPDQHQEQGLSLRQGIVNELEEQIHHLLEETKQLKESQAAILKSLKSHQADTEGQLLRYRQALQTHSKQTQEAIEQCIQSGLKEAKLVENKAWHAIELSKKAAEMARQAIIDADASGSLDNATAEIDIAETIIQDAVLLVTDHQSLPGALESQLNAPLPPPASPQSTLYQS